MLALHCDKDCETSSKMTASQRLCNDWRGRGRACTSLVRSAAAHVLSVRWPRSWLKRTESGPLLKRGEQLAATDLERAPAATEAKATASKRHYCVICPTLKNTLSTSTE